jgi:hypothetical protein
MPGRFSATYSLRVPDIEVLDRGPFTKPILGGHRSTATLEPSTDGLTLTIDTETDNPETALNAADSYAKRFAEHLTFRFCDHVKEAVAAVRVNQTFRGSDPNTVHLFGCEVVISADRLTVRITRRYSGDDIAKALADFSLHEAAPPPVTANDMIVARQMFLAALNVENAVSRFLIIYSALAAFAAFKLGTKGKTQSRVETLLKAEDSTIRMVDPPPQSPIKAKETEFTSARNDFIHAEDRGRQPAAAATVIEGLTPKFQALVGRILRKG